MDGNGRWATSRGMPRLLGHREGAATVRKIVSECARLKLETLTLYSFSSENWKRPKDEVAGLMELCCEFLVLERPMMLAEGIRFRRIPVMAFIGMILSSMRLKQPQHTARDSRFASR